MKKLKIYTDGGSRGNPGNAAIGVIVYEDFGKVVFAHSGFIGTATNNEAEYKAFLKSLKWLSENSSKVNKVDFYLDSKLVVEQINKNWKIKDERMRAFANKAWNILDNFKFKVNISHIKREKNKEADKLVNQALDAHV